MDRRKEFKQKIDDGEHILAPAVHDALTAKVVEKTGEFDVIGTSGYGVSLSSLGLPDVGYLTMDEMIRAARNIADTVEMPVFADMDTGFGNALNARRTIKEVINHTSLAGCFLEDQVDPKRCGHVAGKRVVSRDEGIGKINAISDVRDDLDKNFVIIARTDARGAVDGSLEEAIARGNAYYDAGADVIFVEGPTDLEEVERIANEVNAPLMYNPTGVSPMIEQETLSELGFNLSIITSNRAAIVNLYNHFKQLGEQGMKFEEEFREEIADHPVGDLHEFSDMEDVRKLEEKYLPESDEKWDSSVGHDGTSY